MACFLKVCRVPEAGVGVKAVVRQMRCTASAACTRPTAECRWRQTTLLACARQNGAGQIRPMPALGSAMADAPASPEPTNSNCQDMQRQ